MPNVKIIWLALSLILIIIVYWLRFSAVQPQFVPGDKIRVVGTLTQEPQIIDGRQKLDIAQVSIYLDRFPEYHYQDKVEVIGIVEKGKSGFYLKDPTIKLLEKSQENFVNNFRQRILTIFGLSLPTPFDGLAKGIVLGTKNSLDSSLFDSLKTTGTLHIVVASGTNISLVGGAILYILSPILGRRISIVLSLLVIWFYVLLVGFEPPIVRAGIMGSIAFVALGIGREAASARVLVITAIAMLLINPLWLFDLGFQLSFLATLGILLLTKKLLVLGHYIAFIPKFLKNDLATTLAAQVFVSPVLFLTFGEISWISPIVNMLVLWTIPIIMIGGMVAGVLGVIWEPLGRVGLLLIYPLLWYFVTIVELFA